MQLKCVTMTGADNTVPEPALLAPLSERFPFVEWGILVSHSWTGAPQPNPRWPDEDWITKLQDLADQFPLRLSLHVCGRWTRHLLRGDFEIPAWMLRNFQRVQLNFHKEYYPQVSGRKMLGALQRLGDRQVIFQFDGGYGQSYLDLLYNQDGDDNTVDAVPLFDVSGGRGIVPVTWPQPIYMDDDVHTSYHGYAGGLGPDNIRTELPRIGEAAGDAPVWIDMETKIRSFVNGQDIFDLSKVRQVLEFCEPFIQAKE